jgi:hypothetical protein
MQNDSGASYSGKHKIRITHNALIIPDEVLKKIENSSYFTNIIKL